MDLLSKRALVLDKNLAQTFFQRVAKAPQRTAMLRKVSGVWRSITWQDYQNHVFRFALALQAEGISQGDRVAILSNSRPEWAWTDLSAFVLGAVSVPIYPTLMPEDIEYILKDSQTKIIFAEDLSQKQKLEGILSRLSQVKKVVLINAPSQEADSAFVSLEDWLNRSSSAHVELEIQNKLKGVSKDFTEESLASIVYTSGTSGLPKGVELKHECFLSLMRGAHKALPIGENDVTLLFLPMAHIMGRIEHLLSLGVGWTNAYAENLKVMIDNLIEVRPTILFSVPRIYEKIYSSVLAKVKRGLSLQKNVALKAIAFASTYSKKIENSQSLNLADHLQYKLYSKVLFDKVSHRFGGRLRFCISGGAPFSSEISRFFHASGVLVLEGYGLTETTGPLCVNRLDGFRMGSVGKPLEGVEVKIAEDGEILAKGKIVSASYHNQPEANKESFDSDGFFKTGDIGHIDNDGFLFITDRKKDLIVTAGGKNIAPQKIESMILEDTLFSQAIVLGDKQKYLAALVALNPLEARQLAKSNQIEMGSIESLYENVVFQKLVYKRIQNLNTRLASFESIKKLRILPRELSVEEGELTPSLKIKRKFCQQKYASLIAELFV